MHFFSLLNNNLAIALTYNSETGYFGMMYEGVWRDALYSGFKQLNIYDYGAEETSISGGLVALASYTASEYTSTAPTLKRLSDHLQVYIPTTNRMGMIITRNKINLSSYKSLKIKFSGYLLTLAASTSENIVYNQTEAARTMLGTKSGITEVTLDISSLSGEYFIAVSTNADSSANTGNIYKLVLE